ncbi:unnamed protein product [Protopolystoma xenopodis]|uniref:Uncharacterized protein n=1 Tax=Protopolystoma xenopodis TaxID=117903 RepID=A0A448WYS1_9PLAT|nr:unnamed protein product [Protopolystoma xenopodis]
MPALVKARMSLGMQEEEMRSSIRLLRKVSRQRRIEVQAWLRWHSCQNGRADTWRVHSTQAFGKIHPQCHSASRVDTPNQQISAIASEIPRKPSWCVYLDRSLGGFTSCRFGENQSPQYETPWHE